MISSLASEASGPEIPTPKPTRREIQPLPFPFKCVSYPVRWDRYMSHDTAVTLYLVHRCTYCGCSATKTPISTTVDALLQGVVGCRACKSQRVPKGVNARAVMQYSDSQCRDKGYGFVQRHEYGPALSIMLVIFIFVIAGVHVSILI